MRNTFLYLQIVLPILLILPSGCGPVRHRLYSGPVRPRDEIAILAAASGSSVCLFEVDGEIRPRPWWTLGEASGRLNYDSVWDSSFVLELLPGHHTLTVCYFLVDLASATDIHLELNAQAGHVYKLSATQTGLEWFPSLTDVTEDPEELRNLKVVDR